MVKVHLVIKKEDVEQQEMKEGNKLAVVLDILLATTTIAATLNEGAKAVIPAATLDEAKENAAGLPPEVSILAGELHGEELPGFVFPTPTTMKQMVKEKTLILTTTNGTVALRKAANAKKVYAAALVNNPSVAEAVRREMDNSSTIVVICSGNSGEWSLEDFYGGGHFIDCLVKGFEKDMELTDSAKAALYFYRGLETQSAQVLSTSKVGQSIHRKDLSADLTLAAEKGSIKVVPVLKEGMLVKETIVRA